MLVKVKTGGVILELSDGTSRHVNGAEVVDVTEEVAARMREFLVANPTPAELASYVPPNRGATKRIRILKAGPSVPVPMTHRERVGLEAGDVVETLATRADELVKGGFAVEVGADTPLTTWPKPESDAPEAGRPARRK